MEVAPVQLETEPVVLYPDERVVRGNVETPPNDEPLTGRASLGRPLVLPLVPERVSDDDNLAAFIQAEAGIARYALVYLACSFSPDEGERIARAWVEVDLEREGTEMNEPPIAWSMEPMRSSTALSVTRSLSIKVPVYFVEVGAEVGSTSSSEQLFCEALGLQQPRPSWEFSDSVAQRLTGSHRLHLIVRAPLTPSTGAVSLRARVQRRHIGVFSYTATAESGAPVEFTF